jgi:hypothetical protein
MPIMQKGLSYRYAEVSPDNVGSANAHEEIVDSKPGAFWTLKSFKGWRYGVLNGAVLAFIILTINVAATAYAMTKSSQNAGNDSPRSLYTGDCEQVRKLNVGIHFLINVLSCIPLGASNYSMQCMSAPTRSEVDRWHARKQWLDIGVFSMRNVGKISRWRTLLWALWLCLLCHFIFCEIAPPASLGNIVSPTAANLLWQLQLRGSRINVYTRLSTLFGNE